MSNLIWVLSLCCRCHLDNCCLDALRVRQEQPRRDGKGACFPRSNFQPLLARTNTLNASPTAMAQFFRDLRDRSKALDVNMTDQEIDELKKRNNRRLKRAFDDIIEKYSRDFESTGDEIDLEKEEIVVNNGHILHMQHDRDAGKGKKARRLLTSLATGEGWDEDALDDYVRSSDAETEETEEAIGGSHLLGSDKDADGETEEDSEDDLAEKGDRSSVSRTNSEPSFRTNPTSAEDSNVTPQAEDSDSGFDPLSIDEYTASTQRKQAKHRASAAPPIQHLAKRRRQAPVESPVFTETACEPSEIPTEQDPVSTRTTENTPDVVEDSNSRPQKKRRGGPILEIPVWNRPDMPSNIPLPKTAWDYHWSRRRNPANRTFDEEGNQITTWKEIQTRRRQEKRGMIMPPMATTQNAGVEGKKRGVDATRRIVEGEPTVKLEHMCLSDDVASVCPACEQEALMGTTDGLSYADDDAIIDPEVADTLLKGHTCLSADIASPCAACEREQDTQGEDEEVDFVGTDKDKQPDPDRSGWRGSPAQISNVNDGTDWETTSGSDIDSDFDDDWENNPDLPPPQYVTKIVKYYNRRRQFTFEEDQTILRIIEDEGKSWYEVMEALPHCSKGQLQYRYYNELRSTQWRERQAAAREASKHAKRAEIDKRKQQKWLERASIRSVRDLAGSVFERPLKKSDPQWKEQIQDEDFKLRPLDPCILPEPLPEEARPSPTFHPTVPLIELIKLDDQTDSARLPIWPQAPMLPAQIEGVPMEPIPPLSLLYETPYPDVYANAQYKDGRDDNDSGNASEVELEPEENAFDNLPVGLFEGPSHSGTSAGPSYSQLSAFGFPPQQSGYSLPPSLGICTLPCCQPAQSVPSFAPTPQPPQPDVQQSPPTTIPVAPQYILRQLPAPGSRRSGFGTKFYRKIAPWSSTDNAVENASSSIVQQYSPFPMLSTPITALDASSSRPSTASTRPSTPFAPSPIYPGLSRWPTLADLMVQTQNAISGQQTPNPALTRPSTANSIAVNPQVGST